MTDPIITCPQCKTDIKLTESLAAPLLEATRKQFEKKLTEKEDEVYKREKKLHDQQAELALKEQGIQDQVTTLLKQEREAIIKDEAKKAKELLRGEMDEQKRQVTELQDVLNEREVKLAEAQKAQAELVKMKRDLDDAKREMELTIEKRVTESSAGIRDQAKRQAEEELNLKVKERDLKIKEMQDKIDDLKRKAEQGSQQTQGEVQELELEALLRTKFPLDVVEAIAKGERGSDILHRIIGPQGKEYGTILWESKRTKTWQIAWLDKVRADQRSAKADIAIIVSQALPKDVDTFDHIEGVWVTSLRTMIPVAIALRQSLIEIAMTRQTGEGLHTKMGLVYQYLTGNHFRDQMQAIVKAFIAMQSNLNKEKRAITNQWKKREAQIEMVLQSTTSIIGTLQGIAGEDVLLIESHDLKALDE
ncbi:MAG TPA: DUF2130 domain-containing protein [Gemmatales bacterium]|nr:DUF2130 domain-containing protein [Gemmatales bacterium]